MNQEPTKSSRDNRDRMIAKLKSELQKKQYIIKGLNQENQKLKSYIQSLKSQHNIQEDEFSLNNISHDDVMRSSLAVPRQFIPFLIGITIASIFISIGLVVSTLNKKKVEPPQSTSLKTTINPQQKPNLPPSTSQDDLIYAYATYPGFQSNKNLQNIADKIVSYSKKKKLPVDKLSITIIDVKTGKIGSYNQEELIYPASVVKLFWLVNLFGQLSQGKIQSISKQELEIYVKKMIKNSDNESASRIVNLLTNTISGPELTGQEYQDWLNKRYSLNTFFEKAGYQGINISQKTFPIPIEKLDRPEGRDLQMRGNPEQLIRNKISTQQAARLMYEIFTNKAISPEYSEYLKNWLLWDLNSKEWRDKDPNIGQFNPIRTFFGELLPRDTIFASKAGWTANTRQEVAYIQTKDGNTAYILAIFGEDASYSKNEKIFPEISRLVYNLMTQK